MDKKEIVVDGVTYVKKEEISIEQRVVGVLLDVLESKEPKTPAEMEALASVADVITNFLY